MSKVSVSLTAKVGANGFPSCSRTGSAKFITDAFDDAKEKLAKGLSVHQAPEGQEILVTVLTGSRSLSSSGSTLDVAIAAARRKLLEKEQGGHNAGK